MLPEEGSKMSDLAEKAGTRWMFDAPITGFLFERSIEGWANAGPIGYALFEDGRSAAKIVILSEDFAKLVEAGELIEQV